MPRSLAQLSDDLEPTLHSRDEDSTAALFDELTGYADADPDEVEAMLGWGVLVATEAGMECAGKYGTWFMDRFPDSVLPVKIEFAEYLAGRGDVDEATQLAREYLRFINDIGYLERIEEFSNVRVGASKAFLILTAAYTDVGARSYSCRVLEFASTFPLHPSFLQHYELELERLHDELQDQDNQQWNEKWESFFRDGACADELYKLCEQRGCHMLARRVDLLEGNFRYRSDFRVDENEILLVITDVQTAPSSRPAQLLN